MTERRKPCFIFSDYPLRVTDGGPSGFLAQNIAAASSPYLHFDGSVERKQVTRRNRWGDFTEG